MKILISLFLTLSASVVFGQDIKYAANGPTAEMVVTMKDQLSSFILGMKGISGLGVTACEEKSGVASEALDSTAIQVSSFVNCLYVGASDKKSLAAFQALYPNGTKFDGVYIYSSYMPAFHAQ